jgi:4-hydroxybenzoate polyprenyltransferase
MNRLEKRALSERKAAVRSSMTIWSVGIALLVVVFLILGISGSAPSGFYPRVALGIALLILMIRLVSRRLRSEAPRAAQPDPKSSLNLN